MNFEKGKWYEIELDKRFKHIFKYEKDAKKDISVCLKNGHYSFNSKIWEKSISFDYVMLTEVKELSIQEIQKYLPDNHIDKIKKYNYEVVHCTTQEEWNFVCQKLGYVKFNNWNTYKEKSCIDLQTKSFADTTEIAYGNGKAKILSFQEWCDKFNYKPDFMNKENDFKVGDWVVCINCRAQLYNESIENKAFKILEINNNGVSDNYVTGFAKMYPFLMRIEGGIYFKYLRKAKLEEIPTKDLSNEELLEIAKQYYPINTRFRIAHMPEYTVTVKDHEKYYHQTDKTVNFNIIEEIDGCKGACVYFNGKWAEIISTPKTEVIIEDEFVLPKKWFVVRNKENHKILNKWENDTYHKGMEMAYLDDKAHMFSNKSYKCDKKEIIGYTEITFEQFQKYVLGEKIKTNSVICGTKGNDFDIDTKVFENPNEIYIPKIIKPKNKIDLTINSNVFADIKVKLSEKPKKIVQPIIIKQFQLTI